MGNVEEQPVLNCYFNKDVLPVISEALRAHSAHLRPRNGRGLRRTPAVPVPLDVRMRIKDAWSDILDRLDEGDKKGATDLAVKAGFPRSGFNRLLKDKVRFALHTIHVSSRLVSVPDLKLLNRLSRSRGPFDERSLPIFLRAVLHPTIARRMIPILFASRGSRGVRNGRRTAKTFVKMITALDKGDEAGALAALVAGGYSKVGAAEILNNPARYSDFVLDAVLAYELDTAAIKNLQRGLRAPYLALKNISVAPELRKELSKRDLKVLNLTLDACRAG